MTAVEAFTPRHESYKTPERVVDPLVQFYGYMSHRTPEDMLVVHTDPEDDKPAQHVFGPVGEGRMRHMSAIFSYTPQETGLWIATIEGIKNPDFYLEIQNSPRGVVATSFSPDNEKEYKTAQTEFINHVVDRLGYTEHAMYRVTTDADDPHRLSRAFFVPPTML